TVKDLLLSFTVYSILEPWFFINNKIWLIIAKIGNSSNGPTTNVRAINGSSGKAVIAIANAIGEFLAKVVILKLALSAYLNFMKSTILSSIMKFIIKNKRIGIVIFHSKSKFSISI